MSSRWPLVLALLGAGCESRRIEVRGDAAAAIEAGAPGPSPDTARPLDDAAISPDATFADPAEPCFAKACGPALLWRTKVSGSFERLASASLRVCRNGECVGGTLHLEGPPSAGVGEGARFGDEGRDQSHSPMVDVVLWAESSAWRIDLEWWPWSSLDPRDGDLYEIDMTAANGEQVLHAQERVTSYEHSFPNGERCRPECLYAAIER
jgi:hypothetical protein